MANPHGTPIWYELAATDPEAAGAFYAAVLGWRIGERPAGPMDYRMMIAADGTNVGGLAGIGPDAPDAAATLGWRFYLGVDDVDATVEAIRVAGGSVGMTPFDIDGVGRIAMVADPQGIGFLVMRGVGDGISTVFDPKGVGKCSWNELVSPDQAGANAFYAKVFGWTFPDSMTMPGDMGEYMFVDCAGQPLGATMTAPNYGPPPAWRFYFRATDIGTAADAVRRAGGTIHMGPVDVPGGDKVIIASDPAGSVFGLVASCAAA